MAIKKKINMKKTKFIISLFLLTLLLACTNDNKDLNVGAISSPNNISALMKITQDNSGKVIFIPMGEGVAQYEIYFGDATTDPAFITPGGFTTHTYPEGVYQIKIAGITLNGDRTEVIQELTVSFSAPTDLVPVITTGSNLSINVSATANLETFFQVYYGDVANEVPVDFMEGQTGSHTYAAAGTYSVKVVALSGGLATSEVIQNVTVTNLFAAPAPTFPAANVISMFSDAYTNVPVDTWKTDWSQANLENINISGNATKKYTNLNFVGVETVATPINASTMTYFHTDVWSSNFTTFRVKLVDFGANGIFGGGDDVEHEIVFANPATESWVSLDIPLSSFTGLTTRAHIGQLIFSAAPAGNVTAYVDNVFFYNQAGILTTAAPTPTVPAANVISMFSNAYTNVPVDTWHTDWSSATLTDVTIAGNATKKYSALDFVGIETVTSQINATSMTYFHTDVWSSDFTVFKIKLVDFGANAAYGGGDDKEHEIIITSPVQSGWVSLDIPLANFTGLTTRAHIAQLIYAATPTGNNTVYIDNVYFHN